LNKESPLCANLQLFSQREFFFYCLGSDDKTVAISACIDQNGLIVLNYSAEPVPFEHYYLGQIVVRYQNVKECSFTSKQQISASYVFKSKVVSKSLSFLAPKDSEKDTIQFISNYTLPQGTVVDEP